MDEYIKLFENHTQYETYKNSADYITPNVSYCEEQDEVHYDPWVETRLTCKFNIDNESDQKLYLYFDDFPQNICDDEYDGDMAAFKQDFVNNVDTASPEELNEYAYTGETYEYDGNTYYLWECTNENVTDIKYLLTDRLSFDGLSLEDNINANYCPFIYILDEDKNITYDNTDHPDYYLVAVRSGYKINILSDNSNINKIEVDGNVLPNVVTGYIFSSPGEHIVKYTLIENDNIEDYTFKDCENLTSIIIPDSVTSIGNFAFAYCTNLTSITIPDSVISIGKQVFSSCSGLTSVAIGNSVTSIDTSAFYDCNSLTSVNITDIAAWCRIVFNNDYANPLQFARHLYLNGEEIKDLVIPNSVTSIKDRAFYKCIGLTSVTIPNSVTSIGDSAFMDCTSLTSVAIPNSVTSIGSFAFAYCRNLSSLTIPNSVTTIDKSTFIGCGGLTSIEVESGNNIYDSRDNCNAIINTANNTLIKGCENTIVPNSVTSIGDWAFDDCSSLTSIIIPNSVTSIEYGAFDGCFSLTSVTIGNSVTTIGNSAFSHCYTLTSISIPNSVTSIGSDAFSYSGLTSISIGNSVTSIERYAFHGCSSLTSIICNATIAPTIKNNTFQDVKTGGILTVPAGSTGYNVWMDTSNYYLGKYNWTKVEQ